MHGKIYLGDHIWAQWDGTRILLTNDTDGSVAIWLDWKAYSKMNQLIMSAE